MSLQWYWSFRKDYEEDGEGGDDGDLGEGGEDGDLGEDGEDGDLGKDGKIGSMLKTWLFLLSSVPAWSWDRRTRRHNHNWNKWLT